MVYGQRMFFIEHSAHLSTSVYTYYTVNPGIASFLTGALGISRQSTLNTTWSSGGFAKNGVNAITLGRYVNFAPNFANDNDVAAWTRLIGHESSHRTEVDSEGIFSFYSDYLGQFAFDRLNGKSQRDAYRHIRTEQNAFNNESQIAKFFNNGQNLKDFTSILRNNRLSDTQKSNQLEALGIEKVALPGLEKIQTGLTNQINELKNNQGFFK